MLERRHYPISMGEVSLFEAYGIGFGASVCASVVVTFGLAVIGASVGAYLTLLLPVAVGAHFMASAGKLRRRIVSETEFEPNDEGEGK